jgi:hypothetical protein
MQHRSQPETVHFQGSDPLATAKQAFERIKALTESPTVSEQAIADLLREQAEHPEMLNMDARFLFETGIARYLIDGWQPGKELLFFSAVKPFRLAEPPGTPELCQRLRLRHSERHQ